MNNLSIKSAKQIVIVGGGFGGVRTALDLTKTNIPGAEITLVSEKSDFEYYPALYQVVAGHPPETASVPLAEIFAEGKVKLLRESIVEINLRQRILKGASGNSLSFDILVLALGSETIYFDIPGLREFSFGLKSVAEAMRLKEHLAEQFRICTVSDNDKEEDVCRLHFVIVGGGASGTELAGELAVYTLGLAKAHWVDPSLITIDLIEASSRLLPFLPEDISKKVTDRLHKLGVNIFLNRTVTAQETEEVHLKDMELKTKTVIWTAGVKPHELYSKTAGLELDEKGRVVVDGFLQAKELTDIFVIGDAARNPYSGMAQTAIREGHFVAQTIEKKIFGKALTPYVAARPANAIPIGPGWAAVLVGEVRIYGRFGWWLRRMADLRFLLSILPARAALQIFRS